MRKLLIACLNLLLVFNSIGFQAINATEVDPPSEETYEPSLPTEETNSEDSIKENTDNNVSTEETINTVYDSIIEENTLEINDSFKDEAIALTASDSIPFLIKEELQEYLHKFNVSELYFGTKKNYSSVNFTKYTKYNLKNNYKLYISQVLQ